MHARAHTCKLPMPEQQKMQAALVPCSASGRAATMAEPSTGMDYRRARHHITVIKVFKAKE